MSGLLCTLLAAYGCYPAGSPAGQGFNWVGGVFWMLVPFGAWACAWWAWRGDGGEDA